MKSLDDIRSALESVAAQTNVRQLFVPIVMKAIQDRMAEAFEAGRQHAFQEMNEQRRKDWDEEMRKPPRL